MCGHHATRRKHAALAARGNNMPFHEIMLQVILPVNVTLSTDSHLPRQPAIYPSSIHFTDCHLPAVTPPSPRSHREHKYFPPHVPACAFKPLWNILSSCNADILHSAGATPPLHPSPARLFHLLLLRYRHHRSHLLRASCRETRLESEVAGILRCREWLFGGGDESG